MVGGLRLKTKIPKIIHYCWFGKNPLPEEAKKCIATWKKYCSDYEIIEWNEKNFDINYNPYVKEAYQVRKWAFVSDVARLYALVAFGGIYMDTDVEVIKPLDDLLIYEAVSGFESETQIPTGLMACQANQTMFREFLSDYETAHFIRPDGSMDLTTNVTRITKRCLQYGLRENNTLQTINGFTLLPKDYLCPKDHRTKEIHLTKNSYTIHHFDGSWLGEEEKFVLKTKEKLGSILPIDFSGYCAKFIGAVKYHGFFQAIREFKGWLRRK